MSGRNKFRELARPIDEDPVRRARATDKRQAYEALIALHELRQALGATQAEVAGDLGVSQPYIAKLEKRGEMSLTTLSSYLTALGGRLEVRAVFPEHPEDNVALSLPGLPGKSPSGEDSRAAAGANEGPVEGSVEGDT